MDYCDVFISCLDSHSDGTLCNATFSQSSSSEETKSSKSWMAMMRLIIFSATLHFLVNFL